MVPTVGAKEQEQETSRNWPAIFGQEETLVLHRARRGTSIIEGVLHFRRDFCAGGLMILFGLVAAVSGPSYRVGTLMHMGPGFMPTVLGVVLIVLGVLIAVTATVGVTEGGETDDGSLLPKQPQWLAWLCILAGPAMFVVFGSVGDREATWKSAFILAALVTVFGVLLFHYLLQVPMPVLEWKSPAQVWRL
jgi:hypothetical protein